MICFMYNLQVQVQELNASGVLPHKFTELHGVTLCRTEVKYFRFKNVGPQRLHEAH